MNATQETERERAWLNDDAEGEAFAELAMRQPDSHEHALRRRLIGTGNRMAARLRAMGRHDEARQLQAERMRSLNKVRNEVRNGY